MKYIKYLFLSVAAPLLATSCASSDPEPIGSIDYKVEVTAVTPHSVEVTVSWPNTASNLIHGVDGGEIWGTNDNSYHWFSYQNREWTSGGRNYLALSATDLDASTGYTFKINLVTNLNQDEYGEGTQIQTPEYTVTTRAEGDYSDLGKSTITPYYADDSQMVFCINYPAVISLDNELDVTATKANIGVSSFMPTFKAKVVFTNGTNVYVGFDGLEAGESYIIAASGDFYMGSGWDKVDLGQVNLSFENATVKTCAAGMKESHLPVETEVYAYPSETTVSFRMPEGFYYYSPNYNTYYGDNNAWIDFGIAKDKVPASLDYKAGHGSWESMQALAYIDALPQGKYYMAAKAYVRFDEIDMGYIDLDLQPNTFTVE